MFLGQPEETSANARYYLILLFPGYVFMHLYILNRRYFNCLGKTKEVLIISAFTFVLHIILLCFMVIRGRWGLTGVAVSSSISLGVQLLISEVYTYFQTIREHKAEWILPNSEIILKIPTFLAYGIPGLFECFLAVFPLEIFPIFAGWIGADEIAANIILNNIYFILCHVPFSMSLSAAAFVGNSLGENKPNKTLTYVKANMLLTLLFAVVILCGICAFQDSIGGSYTNSADIMEIFKKALPLFLLFNFGDFIFYITEGILIGVGYQKILVFLIFLWMWVFMIPSAYGAIILYNRGFIDIWIIFCIARMCLAVSNIVVIFVTDWKSVAEEISQSEISKE